MQEDGRVRGWLVTGFVIIYPVSIAIMCLALFWWAFVFMLFTNTTFYN